MKRKLLATLLASTMVTMLTTGCSGTVVKFATNQVMKEYEKQLAEANLNASEGASETTENTDNSNTADSADNSNTEASNNDNANAENSADTSSSTEVPATDPSESDNNSDGFSTDTFVGTYVGDDGSCLTLHADGSAEYYFRDELSTGCSWRIDRDTLYVSLHFVDDESSYRNYDIYATIYTFEPTQDLYFSSDSSRWSAEIFDQVSTDDNTHTVTEYEDMINAYNLDNTDISSSDNTTSDSSESSSNICSLTGYDFTLDDYWQPFENQIPDMEYMDGQVYISDDAAGLLFMVDYAFSGELLSYSGYTDQDFIEIFLNSISSYVVLQDVSSVSIGTNTATLYEYDIDYEGSTATCQAVFFSDPDTEHTLLLTTMYDANANFYNSHSFDIDFFTMLMLAEPNNKTGSSDSIEDSDSLKEIFEGYGQDT